MVKVLIGAFSVVCLATANCQPYVGVDGQVRIINFKQDYGGNVLKNHYPQANIFCGIMLNQNFGIEAGYEFSKQQYSVTKDNPRKVVLGRTIHPYIPNRLRTVYDYSYSSSKINGLNINLIGLFPIQKNIQLIGSFGLANLKLRAKNTFTHTVVTDMQLLDMPITDVYYDHVSYNKRKTVLRLTGGIKLKLNDCVGMRALLSWENTAKLEAKARDSITKRKVLGMAKPKNSFQYGIGLFFTF
jgi:hypothetical protein